MQVIVEFPGEWYLLNTRGSVTGDKDRAIRFDTKEQAQAALSDTRLRFKPKAYKAAQIVEVE